MKSVWRGLNRSGSVDQIGSEARSGNRTHELDPYSQIDSGSDLVWIQLSKMTDDGGLVRFDPTADCAPR